MKNTFIKCVFVLFVVSALQKSASSNIAAKSFSNCCQSFKLELERKSDASKVLCSPNNETYVPLQSFGSSCCDSLKSELKEKWDAYNKLCPGTKNNECNNAKSLTFKGNTNDYAISRGAPVMNATTACFWVKTSQKTGSAFYISYAASNKLHNQFLVGRQTDLRLYMMYNPGAKSITSSSHNIKVNDGLWHHICTTWQSKNGHYSFYKDGKKVGNGSFSDTIGKPIPAKGTWVLGQDQDSLGGGFQAHQSAMGELTGVNVWDKVFPAKEILKMSKSCISGGNAGNVKSWTDFLSGVRGNLKIGKPNCC